MRGEIEAVRTSAARAATNPALWPETLWRLSRMVGGDLTLLEHVDKRTGAVEIGFTDQPGLIATTRRDYEQHYYAVDPRWRAARALPADVILHDDLIGDDRTLDGFEYYADFLKPSGLRYFIGAQAANDAGQTTVLSLQRLADRGRVSDEERQAFVAVLPAIRNAVAIYLRMLHAPSGAMLAAVLDRLADPIAVLRADGRPVFVNRAMAGLIAAGDVVRLCDHALTGARAEIALAIADAMRRAPGSGSAACAATAAAGETRVVVRVAALDPARAREFGPGEDRLFCLLIDDPARPDWAAVDQAMALFGLTRREATVGSHLAAGLGAHQIAARLGISRNTVRTHLAMLRDKLGVHSALAAAAEIRRATRVFD